MSVRVGVLTVSDRCFRGEREDLSGPAVSAVVQKSGWEVVASETVNDDLRRISSLLKFWCDLGTLDLVLTTGGTGLGPRDVTPEATRAVLEKEVPGLAEKARREGEKTTSLAALSRAVCGLRRRTLILNLPGSPKGARESLEAVAGLIPHALEMLRGADHDRGRVRA